MKRASWRVAYGAQMDLWRWLRTDAGQEILAIKYDMESRPLNPDTRDMLRLMYGTEEDRLISADPIFVSGEMCELVEAAADPGLPDPFQPEPLYATDLPCACGFLYFERPFQVPDRFDRPVTIRALSWSPMISAQGDLDGTVERLKADDPEATLRRWKEQGPTFDGSGVAITLYDDLSVENAERLRSRGGAMPPQLDIMHITPWYFGMAFEGNDVDENGVETGAEWWWRIVQITYRLMQQKLASKHSERPERPQRREAKRLLFPERETVVVRLRRAKKEGADDEHGPANYSHRFIVSGHWRNQWYPKSQEHRQLWISPYVKGDEDLPLVVKPRRAMVWSR